MQRQITDCDLCGATDIPPGFVAASVSGDRAAVVRAAFPAGRNSVDLCDACVASLAAWAVSRKAAPVAAVEPAPEPEAAPEAAAPPTA